MAATTRPVNVKSENLFVGKTYAYNLHSLRIVTMIFLENLTAVCAKQDYVNETFDSLPFVDLFLNVSYFIIMLQTKQDILC